MEPTKKVKCLALTKLSLATVNISVFVAVKSSIHTGFVTRAIEIIIVGKYRITLYRHVLLVMIEKQNRSFLKLTSVKQLRLLSFSTCTALFNVFLSLPKEE